jgi:hypothetical protein
MPRVPTLPAGTLRLFARIDRFTCECPRCQQLIVAHFDKPIGQVRRRLATKKHSGGEHLTYNPLTSRLRCPRCRRTFGVGLLLYPVHERSQPQQPYDTQPTYRQLIALRQLAGGFILQRPIKGRDSVNILVEGTCRCLFGRTDPTCPVHGWEEQLGEQTPEEVARRRHAAGVEEEP